MDKTGGSKGVNQRIAIQARRYPPTLKAKSRKQLLEMADRVQKVVGVVRFHDMYDFDAWYNSETEEWEGCFREIL
jgi:hypothetical protein